MKQYAHKILALAAMTMLLSGSSFAQDITKISNSHKSDFSLARDWNFYKKWVVASDRLGEFFFAVLDTSGTNIQACQTPFFRVKDMELSKDTLFFCGSIYNEETQRDAGIMGYFTVTAMPTPTIYYMRFDDMTSINKLEWYFTPPTKHVVMVGSGTDGYDYIMDAYYSYGSGALFPGGKMVSKTRITGVNAKFDDIAVTVDNVVVSARVPDSSHAYVCFIPRTPLACVPFYMSSSIEMKRLSGNMPLGKVLLKTSSYDTVFAVYRPTAAIFNSRLSICQFQGTYNIASKKIAMPLVVHGHSVITDEGTLQDVCFDKSNKNLNILLEMSGVVSTHHRTYHIPTANMSTGGTINTRLYQNAYHPLSLCRALPNFTVTMGVISNTWALSRTHNNDTTGICTTLSTVTLGTETLLPDGTWTKSHTDQDVVWYFGVMPASSILSVMSNYCQ